jgi:hypothetical protein
MDCAAPDFIFPMYADIYYPIITQGGYGQITKEWVFDRTFTCNATTVGGAGKEDIKPAEFLQYENKLISRTKTDLRVTSNQANQAITNILVTNIRSADGNLIYKETAGPRAGRGTIYEVATLEPFLGPFNDIEYFKVLLRKTENQAVTDQ